MNKIDLLKNRRAEVLENGKEIRAKIAELTDESSFAEFDSYSFSKIEFFSAAGCDGVLS